MSSSLTEPAIKLFERLGYDYIHVLDIAPDAEASHMGLSDGVFTWPLQF